MKRKPDFLVGDGYLARWWIIPRNKYFNIYLHRFTGNDEDRALHDNLWRHLCGMRANGLTITCIFISYEFYREVLSDPVDCAKLDTSSKNMTLFGYRAHVVNDLKEYYSISVKPI